MNVRKLPKQKRVAIIMLIVATVLLAVALVWPHFPKKNLINSYETCVKQGNQVLDSYPSVCVTKDGRQFINPTEHIPAIPH